MERIFIALLVIFAAFGAFCFNAGHNRAYRLVLKALLKGQIEFIEQKTKWLEEHRDTVSQSEFSRCYISYQTVGQLVLGWYRYFANVRNDKELKDLRNQIKEKLEAFLSKIEIVGNDRNLKLEVLP